MPTTNANVIDATPAISVSQPNRSDSSCTGPYNVKEATTYDSTPTAVQNLGMPTCTSIENATNDSTSITRAAVRKGRASRP